MLITIMPHVSPFRDRRLSGICKRIEVAELPNSGRCASTLADAYETIRSGETTWTLRLEIIEYGFWMLAFAFDTTCLHWDSVVYCIWETFFWLPFFSHRDYFAS